MMRLRWLAAASLAALSVASFAQSSTWDKVRTRAEEFRKEKKAVGLSVAVVQKGQVVFSEGFGWADENDGKKATGDTIYRLASISKPLSAIGVMKLVEDGKADLNADVRTYAPSWPDKGRITLWNLMTHTSGIRHYVTGKPDNNSPHYKTCTEALKVFSGDDLAYPIGSKNQYSTHAWTLVGAAVEGITGGPFSDYINEMFANARVSSLRVEDLTKPAPANRSSIYGRRNEEPYEYPFWLDGSWKAPGGGMESSAADLAKFVGLFLDGGVVKASTVDQMLTPQKSPASNTQGLGWGVNGNMFMHSGSQQGSNTFICGFKDSRTVIAVLCNTEGTSPTTLALEIATLLGAR